MSTYHADIMALCLYNEIISTTNNYVGLMNLRCRNYVLRFLCAHCLG